VGGDHEVSEVFIERAARTTLRHAKHAIATTLETTEWPALATATTLSTANLATGCWANRQQASIDIFFLVKLHAIALEKPDFCPWWNWRGRTTTQDERIAWIFGLVG